MAYSIINKIVITQVPTTKFKSRNKVFTFDFVNEFRSKSSWANLTDTATIVLPRSVYFIQDGQTVTWDKTQVYGNPDKEPLIQRGDKIQCYFGYSYFSPNKSDSSFDRNTIISEMPLRFEGYITKIANKTPITLECEDNMYALKQTKVENKEWLLDGNTYTLEKMLKEMLSKSTFPDVKNFTINTDNYEHKFGKFITFNVTMAQVLDELRKHYHCESFFRGSDLRCGIIRYYPDDRKNHLFHFQKNIISDSLDYTRDDDIRIGIKAKSIFKVELQQTNNSGKFKTTHKTLETNVGDQDGEIRTLYFYNVTTTDELKKQAEVMLPYLKYEGFRGQFTTFGLPYVKHGDSVQLVNAKTSEQNGTYLVKGVETHNTCDGGLRQVLSLDIRVDGLTTDQLINFQKNGL